MLRTFNKNVSTERLPASGVQNAHIEKQYLRFLMGAKDLVLLRLKIVCPVEVVNGIDVSGRSLESLKFHINRRPGPRLPVFRLCTRISTCEMIHRSVYGGNGWTMCECALGQEQVQHSQALITLSRTTKSTSHKRSHTRQLRSTFAHA
jgi:hypothetical protein